MNALKNFNPSKKMEQLYSILIIAFVLYAIASLISSCSPVVKTSYSNSNSKTANAYYYLPAGMIKVTVTAKVEIAYSENKTLVKANSRIIEQSFSATSEIVPDTRYYLGLNYKTNFLASDQIKYVVNSKGLLETVNVTVEDRLPQIINKIAEAPKTILSATTARSAGQGKITIKIETFTQDFLFKASEISSNPSKTDWDLSIVNESDPTDRFSLKAGFKVISQEPLTKDEIISAEKNAQGVVTKAEVNGKFPGLVGTNNKNEVTGILSRPITTLTLIFDATEAGFGKGRPTYLSVPDNSRLLTVPINRAAFVKKVNNITLVNGIVTSNEITKPSELEGFISIPIDILKAVVSIPGQLITLKIDNTQRLSNLEATKLAYEKAMTASEKYGQEKEKELENLKIEIEKNKFNNSLALEKNKLDTETALAGSEKARLSMQKELETLKLEIEKLKKQ